MAEKRKLRRLRKRLSVRFGVTTAERLAFTEDISDHGLFIKTTNISAPGSQIVVEIAFPDGGTVVLDGRVAWARKVPPQMIHLARRCGMGVRIVSFREGEEAYRLLCSELAGR